MKEEMQNTIKNLKEDFKKILKKENGKFTEDMEVKEFKDELLRHEEFNSGDKYDQNKMEYYAKYLQEKLKKRIKKAKKKFFNFCAKEGSAGVTEFDKLIENLKKKESMYNYFSCLTLEQRKNIFEEVMEKIKNGEKFEKLLNSENKKRRKRSRRDHNSHHDRNDKKLPEPENLRKRSRESSREDYGSKKRIKNDKDKFEETEQRGSSKMKEDSKFNS